MADPSLAQLSDTLFWVTMVVYAVAMLGYFANLAFGWRVAGIAATTVAWGGVGTHVASVVARGLATDRVPWGNMFEYSTMIGLLLVVLYLVVVEARLRMRQLGGFALGAGVLALASARFVYAPAGPLVPALDSYWIKIHVIAAILGSSLFGLSFIFTVLFLVKERFERRAQAVFAGSTVGAANLGADGDEAGMPADHVGPEPEHTPRAAVARGLLARLPSASTFDMLTYRTISFAFPIWTFAVIAGAIWAHEAWGRYWGWDPKETWAFVTWVIYAGYLHARATRGWRGRPSAIISCVGFASVLFTYYAVNLWIAGLHSYAK